MGNLLSGELTEKSHTDGEFDPPIKEHQPDAGPDHEAPEPQREATYSESEFDGNTLENNASVKLSTDFF